MNKTIRKLKQEIERRGGQIISVRVFGTRSWRCFSETRLRVPIASRRRARRSRHGENRPVINGRRGFRTTSMSRLRKGEFANLRSQIEISSCGAAAGFTSPLLHVITPKRKEPRAGLATRPRLSTLLIPLSIGKRDDGSFPDAEMDTEN